MRGGGSGDRPRLARSCVASRSAPRRAPILEAHGDRANTAHAAYLEVRRLVLIGHIDDAERLLAALDHAFAACVAGRA